MGINEAINKRYSETTCSSLGCGDNLSKALLKPGEKVLDLGCGSGGEALAAAAMVGNEGFVAGIDLTPEMIAKATEKVTAAKQHNIEFICAGIENIPYPEKTFDVVISNCVINHTPDKEKAFQEIYRVLKLGGRFVISDAVSQEPLPDSVKNDPQAWADCYGGAVTETEYLDIIIGAGFKTVEILNKRQYLKAGFDFASLTLRGLKI